MQRLIALDNTAHVARGRNRELTKATEIARLLSRGISYTAIAAQVELSHAQVKRRVHNLRLLLAQETGDGAWANPDARTPVEVGQRYLVWLDRRTPEDKA